MSTNNIGFRRELMDLECHHFLFSVHSSVRKARNHVIRKPYDGLLMTEKPNESCDLCTEIDKYMYVGIRKKGRSRLSFADFAG